MQDVAIKLFEYQEYPDDLMISFKKEVMFFINAYLLNRVSVRLHLIICFFFEGNSNEKASTSKYFALHGFRDLTSASIHCHGVSSPVGSSISRK